MKLLVIILIVYAVIGTGFCVAYAIHFFYSPRLTKITLFLLALLWPIPLLYVIVYIAVTGLHLLGRFFGEASLEIWGQIKKCQGRL